ncbi:MAG: hypothetical protein OEY48_01575 [Gammaproteobacteria bacterium]|nr:hypothetical protein [Gammaproteobacteria bacterium]MDH5591521.1 hypothetical protein [Gammaproteobacteria bacterium]
MKRIENVILLKVIGSCELLAALAMFYLYNDKVPAVIGAVILLGLSANSFYQAHKCYQRQYAPKKTED